MAEGDRTNTLTFLYKIIDDNQATIRFLDTKAGFGIAVLGAIVGKVLLDQDQLFALKSHGPLIVMLSSIFGLSVILAATLGFRTVFPTVNPAQNVSFPDDLEPRFFISRFSRRRLLRLFSSNKKFATLETTHTAYCTALREASAERLESIVAAEVLKLSFIRQLKTDRLGAFAKMLVLTVILFTILMFAAGKSGAEITPQSRFSSPAHSTTVGPRDIYNFNCSQPTQKP